MSRYLVNIKNKKIFNGKIHRYEYKLLWNNTSPTADFSAQSITIDAANYNSFLILYKNGSVAGNSINSKIILKGYASILDICLNNQYRNDGLIMSRNISSTTNTNIVFENAYNQNNAVLSVQNSALIPLKIYGFNLPL